MSNYCGAPHPDNRIRNCLKRPGHEGEHRNSLQQRWTDDDPDERGPTPR